MRQRTIIFLPFAFIIIGVVARLLPHAPNVAPVTAMALYGGAMLSRRYAFAFPLLAMIIGDSIIGFYTAGIMAAVYGSFIISGAIGLWIRRQRSARRIAFGTLAASVQFFLLTNFAVWLFGQGTFYPHTWAGLSAAYVAALPFFRNTLAGDALYAAAFFGLTALAVVFLKRQNAELSRLPTLPPGE